MKKLDWTYNEIRFYGALMAVLGMITGIGFKTKMDELLNSIIVFGMFYVTLAMVFFAGMNYQEMKRRDRNGRNY